MYDYVIQNLCWIARPILFLDGNLDGKISPNGAINGAMGWWWWGEEVFIENFVSFFLSFFPFKLLLRNRKEVKVV